MIFWEILFELLGAVLPNPGSRDQESRRATDSEFERAASRRRLRWGVALIALTAGALWWCFSG